MIIQPQPAQRFPGGCYL